MRIRNTLQLEELEISEACLELARQGGGTSFEVNGAVAPLVFDAAGNLPALL
jgi:hypothetical protein